MEQLRDIFTPDQAAVYLQVNRETVYRYIRDGRLVASRLGRAYRIPRQSVERLLWSTRTRTDIAVRNFSDAEREGFLTDDRLPLGQAALASQLEDVVPSTHAAHAIVARTAGIFRHAAKQPPATIAEEMDAFEDGVAQEVMRGV